MNRRFRKAAAAAVVWTLIALMGSAVAAIKVWNSSETLQVSDLNANFNTVNTAATALVTNAKVDPNAAIAHTKLATPSLVPKAWVKVANCTADPCTMLEASPKVSGVNYAGTVGAYTVQLSGTWADVNITALVTANNAAERVCYVTATTISSVSIQCKDLASTIQNTGFSVLIMDFQTVN